MTYEEKINDIITSQKKYLKKNIYELLLVLSVLTYIIVFSSHMLSKHYGFATFAWDLGIFDQSFFSTAYKGKLLYSTPELYQNPSGSYFGSKFSPILLVLLPFYMMAPNAGTLLVLKTILLALAAIPLFYLTESVSGDKRAGIFVALSYLLYPGLHGANNFDFQQQAFIPLILFSLTYFLVKRRWKWYSLFLVFSNMITEHVSIIVLLFSIYYLYGDIVKPVSKNDTLVNRRNLLIFSLILSGFSFFISKQIRLLYPVNHDFIDYYQASSTFEALEFDKDILYLPLFLLQNPDKLINAISYDFLYKFLYMIFLLAPLLLIPFKSKLIFGIIVLSAPFLISNYRPYYLLGSHYALYLLPFTFLGLIEGLINRKLIIYDKNTEIKILNLSSDTRSVLMVSVIFALSLSPLSPFSSIISKSSPILWYAEEYQNEAYTDSLHELIDLVPDESSILVQNNIFPHVSNRINSYVLPVIFDPSVEDYLKSYIDNQLDRCEYILLDLENYDTWRNYVLARLHNSSEINPYAFTGASILFKKNYAGEPFFVPHLNYQVFQASRDMRHFQGSIVADPTTELGSCVFSSKHKTGGTVLYGPYVPLPLGYYDVIFSVKITGYNSSNVAIFDVCDDWGNQILTSKVLNSSNVVLGKWMNVSIPLYVEKLRTKMEFRVFTEGSADIFCEKVTVKKSEFQEMTFIPSRDMHIDQAVTVMDNSSETGYAFFAEKMVTNGTILYGPYISLPPGRYQAIYTLKVPEQLTKKVVALDISTKDGREIVSRCDLYGHDFDPEQWVSFPLSFQVTSPFNEYEFRIITTGFSDVYCEKIVLNGFSSDTS